MTWRRAVVVGASGGIGRALSEVLEQNGTEVVRLSRSAESSSRIDLEDEASIAQAADSVSENGNVDLVMVASGILAPDQIGPEKSWRSIDPAAMARVFALNAIGPALIAKHFVPLLPKDQRSAFAVLGARVGSIGDNRLGGWYSYRASKAALAQIVRTLSIELARTHPLATCVALHPGTVATRLSERFAREAMEPAVSARHLLAVLDGLGPDETGGHFDWKGERIAP